MIQFAQSFAWPGSAASVASNQSAISRVAVSAAASYGARPCSRSRRARFASGSSGISARTRSIQSSAMTSGSRSGSGKYR